MVYGFLLCVCGCSSLQKEDGSYAPAHILADSRLERAGRAAGRQVARKPSLGRGSGAGSPMHTRSAALLVIGDEILAAKVQDANTSFLCGELHAIGWRVAKVRLTEQIPV